MSHFEKNRAQPTIALLIVLALSVPRLVFAQAPPSGPAQSGLGAKAPVETPNPPPSTATNPAAPQSAAPVLVAIPPSPGTTVSPPVGTAGSDALTLADVRATAVQVSPAVRVSQLAVAQAQARLGQARAQRRPQLSFNTQASFSNGAVYQPPPSNETFGALQNSITLPFPSQPKLTALEQQARSQYEATLAQYDAARFDAATQAQNAYFSILKQQALIQNAQQNLAQAQAVLDAAQRRFADGAAPQLDALKAQTPVLNAQAAVLQAEAQARIATETLNNLLQRDLDAPIAVNDVAAPAPLTVSLDDARRFAATRAADVRAAQASVRAAQAALEAARRGRAPDLSLQAIDARSKDVTGFSRLDTLQVSVTVPLSDSGLLQSQIQRSRKRR